MKNKLELKSDWNEIKIKLKQKFESLTDEDVQFDSGKQTEVLNNIQKKLGKSKLEILKIILPLGVY